MKQKKWNSYRLPLEEHRLWELYNENSKLPSFHQDPFSRSELEETLKEINLVLPVRAETFISLEPKQDIKMNDIFELLTSNQASAPFIKTQIPFTDLSNILHLSFEANKEDVMNIEKALSSPAVISPLEIYILIQDISGITPGIYHFDPFESRLGLIRKEVSERLIQNLFLKEEGPGYANIYVFITGVFNKSAQIYGERGYRYILLEAGKLSQKLSLAAKAMGLGSESHVRFIDRRVEDLLSIDGVKHSILSILAMGKPQTQKAK